MHKVVYCGWMQPEKTICTQFGYFSQSKHHTASEIMGLDYFDHQMCLKWEVRKYGYRGALQAFNTHRKYISSKRNQVVNHMDLPFSE